jgi:putative sigma-54 modulation protein
MNITYTGKQERFYPAQLEKLDARFAKLGKLLDGKGEKLTHVILTHKRNMHNAEITVNYLDHSLIGAATGPDQFQAITAAIDKLEKQVLKVRAKRREIKKVPKAGWNEEAKAEPAVAPRSAAAAARSNGSPRVFRVNHNEDRKPMTLEEAMLELVKAGDYTVYRDANKNCLSVLVRRSDGNFDLIEG